MGVNDEDQMVLDNIDEFIKDENKVVTYKWLSLSLSLNVNKAKSYLEQYYSQNNKDLKAIYFVSGVKQDGENNKLHCYQLVRKESLNDVKSEYSELMSSHIYSLQKCQIKDASTLYLSDIDIIKETLERCNDFSPIQCEQAKTNKRSVLNNTKTSNGNGIHVEKKVIPSTATVASKPKDTQQKESPPLSFFNKTAGSKVVAEKKESKSNSEQKEKEKKQQKTGIANAFLKSKPKTEANISKKEDVEKKVVSKTKSEEIIDESSNKNKFNKSDADKEKENTKESKNENLSKKRKVKEESSSDDDFESFVSNSKKKESLSVSKKQKEQIENPVLNDSDEIDVVEATPEPTKQKTKRRRKEVKSAVTKKDDEVSTQETENTQTIAQTSQESSERITQSESTSSSERTEVISATNESSAEQCGQKKPKIRRRRRVLKSKQFLDEDGFMVTKKEYESESYSEESDIEMMTDEKIESLPPQKKQSLILKKSLNELDKKSKAYSKKQKQSSMNSFFKKK